MLPDSVPDEHVYPLTLAACVAAAVHVVPDNVAPAGHEYTATGP